MREKGKIRREDIYSQLQDSLNGLTYQLVGGSCQVLSLTSSTLLTSMQKADEEI
jgi:hypothetical protein